RAARELGHQAVRGPEQGGLARSRRSDREGEGALPDAEVDVLDRGALGVGVRERHPLEDDCIGHDVLLPISPGSARSAIAPIRTGTASAGSVRSPWTVSPRRRCASRTRPTLATVRGAIDNARAAASAGSWKWRGAIRTNPNGSVTALKVPKTTRIVPRRKPSRN